MKRTPVYFLSILSFSLFFLILTSCAKSSREPMMFANKESMAEDRMTRPSGKKAVYDRGKRDLERTRASRSSALSGGRSKNKKIGNASPSKPGQKDGRYAPHMKRKASDRKLIYTARLRLKVEKLDAAAKSVREIVANSGGYISRERASRGSASRRISFSLRIPQGSFRDSLGALEKLAKVVASKSVTADDVTEKFFDIQTRLRSKRAAEKQYLAIMRRARNVKEILAVQSHLRSLQEEIEVMEGSLRYLSNQVSFSTIHLTIYTYDWTPGSERGFFDRLWQALYRGWKEVLNAILGLVSAWPFILLLSALVFFGVKYARKYMKKKSEAENASAGNASAD